MKPRDLDRIGFVTRHFTELQGLRARVPLGLMMASGGLFGVSPRLILLLPYLGILAGAVFLVFRLKSYYRDTFGEVERPARRPVNRWEEFWYLGVPIAAGGVLLLVTFLAGDSTHDSLMRLRCVVYSVGFFAIWFQREHRLSDGHYLVPGLVFLGLAAPGKSSAFLFPALVNSSMAQILCGAALILAGLLDHRQLVRSLGPAGAPAPELAGAAQVEELR
jgi:hypothetical protein